MTKRRNHCAYPRAVSSLWLILIAILFATNMRVACAEVEVKGAPEEVYLRADNAALIDVLAALAAEFGLKYPSSANAGRTVTGVYSGSLRYVLSRILDGSNYIIKFSGEDVEIKLLGSHSHVAAAPPSAPAAQLGALLSK